MSQLWPENIVEGKDESPPIAILKEEASALGTMTQNLVLGEISALRPLDHIISKKFDSHRTQTHLYNAALKGMFHEVAESEHSLPFRYSFNLVGPTLQNYRYQLFLISHDTNLYPVRFDLDMDLEEELGENVIAGTRGEFLKTLEQIFSAKKTRQVIHAILAQAAVFQNNVEEFEAA